VNLNVEILSDPRTKRSATCPLKNGIQSGSDVGFILFTDEKVPAIVMPKKLRMIVFICGR